MIDRVRPCIFVAVLSLSAPACAMPLPDCAGGVAVAAAPVVRVEKDGALILADGRSVLLEGIRMPGADRPQTPLAAEALNTLRALAMKGPLTLTTTVPSQDRYDRLRAQAFGDVWLQLELLKRGLARVSIMPDRQECVPDFLEAEEAARSAGRGLWAQPEFAVRKALDFSAPEGSFQIVEGRVANVATHDGRTFLDFNIDYRKGLSVTIAPEDRKAFRASEPALEDLVGRDIRVRGTVTNFNSRPEIALFNSRQIEVLN